MEVNRNKRRKDCPYENGLIIAGFQGGKKARQLHEELQIPISTLYCKWKRFLKEGTLVPKPRCGSPKKTTDREDSMIVREVKKNPFMTCKQVAVAVGRPDLSPDTIKRRLVKVGKLKCRTAAKKPWLRPVNRVNRLAWARAHVNWTQAQWREVLWSDESKFVIRYHASRKVWRLKGQRFNPKNTVKTVKHDKKVMVWGCFSYGGVGRLYRIHGIMDAMGYHSILQRQMIPSAEALFPHIPWTFQQDNDPKHTAGVNKRYLQNKNVNVLDWPAQSPDLNPIENLWNELDRRLKRRACNTENELFEVLKEGWDALPQDYLQKLVDSMPNRCRAVILARGNGTKY
jgi:hypothetical protein